MASILFVGYLVALSWLLTRMTFFRSSGLTRIQLILIYLLKVAVGIFYGWVGIYYAKTANMTDTWLFHAGGLQEENLLLNDPIRFFTELITDPYDDGRWKLLGTENSYWNDLKENALIKGLAILNLFTGGHYLVNVLFFNFFSLLGVVGFYRVLIDRYPGQKTAVGLTAIFLPSVLFWTSGIHKEGILFTALGMIIYATYFSFLWRRWNWKRITALTFSVLFILIFRNHLLFALLPALALWIILQRFPLNKGLTTVGVYSLFLVIFFISSFIDPRADLPAAVARKQQEFLQLKGKSSMEVTRLEPTPLGFLKNLPQSIDMALTRPHLNNVRHLLSLAAFLEVVLWGVLLFLWIRFRDRSTKWPDLPIDYFLIAFSISSILIIGFSINNLGAIARYRSIVLVPLLAPLLAGIDWKKLTGLIKI